MSEVPLYPYPSPLAYAPYLHQPVNFDPHPSPLTPRLSPLIPPSSLLTFHPSPLTVTLSINPNARVSLLFDYFRDQRMR